MAGRSWIVVVWGVIEELESVNQADFLKFKKIQIIASKVWFWRHVRQTEKSREVWWREEDAIPCPPEKWAIHRREPCLVTHEESGSKMADAVGRLWEREMEEKVHIVGHHCFLCKVGIETARWRLKMKVKQGRSGRVNGNKCWKNQKR